MLWSTRALLDSVLSPVKADGEGGGGAETGEGAALLPAQRAPPPEGLRLRAGILRRGGGAEGEPEVLADEVGVSASALKSLSLTSGSLVRASNLLHLPPSPHPTDADVRIPHLRHES